MEEGNDENEGLLKREEGNIAKELQNTAENLVNTLKHYPKCKASRIPRASQLAAKRQRVEEVLAACGVAAPGVVFTGKVGRLFVCSSRYLFAEKLAGSQERSTALDSLLAQRSMLLYPPVFRAASFFLPGCPQSLAL